MYFDLGVAVVQEIPINHDGIHTTVMLLEQCMDDVNNICSKTENNKLFRNECE
jgi:hypothetical protein